MLRLIVCDFDGTLMRYGEKSVSQGVKEKIEAALSKNIIFAVSSGRTYGELVRYLPEFADKIWFVCADGAYYAFGDKVFYERKIECADLAPFFALAVRGGGAVFHGAKNNYSVGTLPREAEIFAATEISRIGEIKEKIFKITAYGAEQKLPGGSGLRMHWDGGEHNMAQYVNRFANKGTALSDLQVRLMLTKFETACIGDSGNDTVMMKNAKYSYAVSDRSSALLAAAGKRVECTESALAELLET